MNAKSNDAVAFETLEDRQMMSVGHHHHHHHHASTATPKAVVPSAALTVNQNAGLLTVTGTTGNDQISISQNGNSYTVRNGSWSSVVTGSFTKVVVKGNGGNDSIVLDKSVTENADLYGGAGNDTLAGGSGNDQLFAGAGSNVLYGQGGNDTFVTIGSTADSVSGGDGSDSFWMDNSTSEIVTDLTKSESAAGHLHKVTGFLGGVSKLLAGQKLADPSVVEAGAAYKNFAGSALFSDSGPAEDDVKQGQTGDCWFLATLSSVAKINADRIRQSVVDLGDGTYAVQFTVSGKTTFIRVDADFQTFSWGGLTYADKGRGNSMWVAVMEKALATVVQGYEVNGIDGGWMADAYAYLGASSQNIWGATSATDLFNKLSTALKSGKSATFAIANVPAGAPLIASHAYTVDHVTLDAKGNMTVTLRNPWGIDGAGNDGANDGYVTITAQQAFSALLGASIAAV